MQDSSSSERLWYVAKSVLTSPLSLGVWAVGGALALAFHTILPLFLALAAQIPLLYWRLNDEEFLRRLFIQRQERNDALTEQKIESALEQMDFETRQRVRYVVQLQKELTREIRAADVPKYARADLDRIATQLGPLLQKAVRLAGRKQQLARYLQNVDERALKSYCNNLRQRIESTEDPVARGHYEQALKARESELQTYVAIGLASQRIDSQLENVEATLASWKARVIRIKTADISSAASVSEGLYTELDNLNTQIDLLDRSVAEALAGEEITLAQQT